MFSSRVNIEPVFLSSAGQLAIPILIWERLFSRPSCDPIDSNRLSRSAMEGIFTF